MPTYSEEMLRSLRQDLEMTNGGLRDSEERAPASTQRSPWAVPKPQASPAVPPPKPKSSQADYPEVMKLNVGGRRFEVMRSTLMKSGALSAMISSTLAWPAEPDGSYFLDTDPDAFEHVLRFMRRPTIFPLFWSKSEGFDYALYHRVQTEAEVFKVDALHDWIRDKKYLDAIHMHTLKAVKENLDEMKEDTRLSNYSQDCYVTRHVRKVYLCPRGIAVHRGRAEMCGAACRQAQEGYPIEYDDIDSLQVTTVGTIVTFNPTACESV